ncbi:MAG TPA: glutamate--tRNA ligase [Gammaproteobacteria bacterium]|nr:glutamate--tRNA ligase [Gammaproteobacteria bacterium]
MKTRFAPSPTGWMHFGNARTALFNFLFAQKQKYTFLLRIEDTDLVRSKREYQDDLLADLQWLNLQWHEGPYLQSERSAIYDQYYKQLEDQDLAYPCFCTEETLSITRKVQMAAGQPPRYPGTCRNLSKEEVQKKLQAGVPATLRFHVPRDTMIEFVDLVKGPQRFAGNDIGDFIIRRNDGSASFMFCNAIDDATMEVTHALRGDDHLTNTPRQIMILNALKLPHPQYGHFAMINGTDGAPLSKRNGSEAVRDLRAQGYHPLAVANYLARLGHYYANNAFMSLEQLADEFALQHISTSPARHDVSHLRHWQKEAVMGCSLEEIIALIAPFAKDAIPKDRLNEFAELVRDNILMPSDARLWVSAVAAPTLDFSIADKELLRQAGAEFFAAAIEAVQQNMQITFKELADCVKDKTGRKGKDLFMPLRVALTGHTHGPELAKLMAFMPHDLILNRFINVRTNYL